MELRASVEGRQAIVVGVGRSLEIGRNDGPGQIAVTNQAVSRRHGVIAFEGPGWSVTATGTQSGLVVYDHETPSRVHVPRGVGPVAMPFAQASVVIEVRQQRYPVTVTAPGLDGWAGSWASTLSAAAGSGMRGATRPPWDGVRWRDERTGKPLRWYQALVAMCEPFLTVGGPDTVPSDSELARRIGTTVNVVQSRLMGEIRDHLGFQTYTSQLRQTMVAVAISQRLVTADDLTVLDVPSDPVQTA